MTTRSAAVVASPGEAKMGTGIDYRRLRENLRAIGAGVMLMASDAPGEPVAFDLNLTTEERWLFDRLRRAYITEQALFLRRVKRRLVAIATGVQPFAGDEALVAAAAAADPIELDKKLEAVLLALVADAAERGMNQRGLPSNSLLQVLLD